MADKTIQIMDSSDNVYPNLVTKKGAITARSGFSLGEVKCLQCGNVVYVKFYVTGTFTSGSEYIVADISGVDLPRQAIRTIAGCGSAAYDIRYLAYAYFGTNGTIAFTPRSSGNASAIIFSLTYITNEA